MICKCPWRAKCEYTSCEEFADWSVMVPGGPKFMCDGHWEQFDGAGLIPGIDRPPHASDFWRPSIMDMVRLAGMELRRRDIAREDGELGPPVQLEDSPRIKRMTPAQRETLVRLRELHRELRR